MKPLVLVPVLSLLVLTACGPSTPEQAPAVEYRLVKAAAVESGPAADLIEVPGIGAFRDETRLSFKVGGVIERVSVREGESVEKGQRLGALNKQDVDAAVSQASANFDKAQRDLVRGRMLREEVVMEKVLLEILETD